MRGAIVSLALTGCFSLPSDEGTRFSCPTEPACPDGFTCLNQRCVATPRSFLFLDFRGAGAPDEDLDHFPLLVKLAAPHAQRDKMRDDASDLRFTTLDGTVLAHELDTITDTEVIAWVRVPLLQGNDTILRVDYGQATLPPALAPETVWSDRYAAVFHFTGDSLRDSTANHHDGRAIGSTMSTAGSIGGGRSFQNPSAVELAAIDLDAFTISGWMYQEMAEGGYNTLAARQRTTTPDNDFWLGERLHEGVHAYVVQAAATTGVPELPASASKFARFVRLAATASSTGVNLYVDDDAPTTKAEAFRPGNQNRIFLGADRDMTGTGPDTAFFDGVLDEVRIETAERSPAWLRADYLSQSDALITYGPVLGTD